MLGTSGDGLITTLTSYLTSDKVTPSEAPPPPTDRQTEFHPTLAATFYHNAETGLSARPFAKPIPRHSLKRSVSELVVPSQVRNDRLTATAALNTVRFMEDERRTTHKIPFPTRIQLQTPRPASQRSISNSRHEIKSRYHDPAISSASLQKQLVEQTKPPIRRIRFPSSTQDEIMRNFRPEPTRSTAMRSDTEPDPARAFANPKTHSCNVTLKPCIKKKAKSTTTTPPGEFQGNAVNLEPVFLRRVRTVDFQEAGAKPSPPPPQVTITPRNPTEALKYDIGRSAKSADNHTETVKWSASCPNTISTAKGTAAEPAITRTDVHVIAIAPSWNAENLATDDGADPATPTMQIIETKSGSYEVIWDDVPPEHTVRTRGRRSSSAGHALETASPSAKRGLERVNSKLAGWSGTWNSPSDSFKPTIVVFPNDDGRATRYDCTVDEEEDLAAVPPNSRMISLQDALQDTPQAGSPPLEQSLVVPSVEIRGRKTKSSVGVRKLSNLEEADTKFRDHRDSVAIAHSRLVRSGAVSPELFARVDSVSLGKKRMHARNHAASSARTISRQKEVLVEALGLLADEDISPVTLPTVKEHAAQVLNKSNSPSILQSPQQAANERHIRVVE
ncbi:unnamed protein product [Alternaria alternata]